MDITILAVSKRLNGVCIAGIGNYNRWIRPTKKEELMLGDIKINDKDYISVGTTYEFHFSARSPVQCQSENYLMEGGILYKATLAENERRRLFPSLCENPLVTSNPLKNITDILKARNRSLVFLGPVKIDSAYFHKEGDMKAPEITFSVNDIYVKGIKDKTNLQCTDLKFWAYAKSLLRQRNIDSITLDGAGLKGLLGYDKVFIAIGLTKHYHGINWPMIIGVHTLPDYHQVIDYNDL